MRAASQRLAAAEVLLRERLNLDAQYIGGYTMECALKALILYVTDPAERGECLDHLTRGASMHRPEVLLGLLHVLGVDLPEALARRMRRFDWTVDLRYETGHRDTGETRALLTTCRRVYNWVKENVQ